ncbi:hypothetical protein [Tsukamurella sp. 1534]|uniref:hypothetical protein n=1 Tax=Tsukamurella sp. 1534 TaxID=1151061 RepID=UPI0002DBEFDF|nr:hypothetical protein [Tsukamurella sp. 1534]
MIRTRSVIALAAGATLAGGLALPGAANAAPGPSIPLCANTVTLAAATPMGPDGYLHPEPGKVDLVVARPSVPSPPGTRVGLNANWQNIDTGATGGVVRVVDLGAPNPSAYFASVPTGPGRVVITAHAVPYTPAVPPTGCTSSHTVK